MAQNTKKIISENLIKNLLVLMVTGLTFPFIFNNVSKVNTNQVSDLLIVISILLLIVEFTGFSFTYEKVKLNSIWERVLAHSITFIALLLTALLLEVIVIIAKFIYPSFLV
ncbi:hypothetical protein KKD62_03455 [Patescibacteria group bacterium]|nr:hypothetical protein [Patescibacteria group bacterium]MBU1931344.1 hypothetical protein [Patescibacteria group bacterium]